MRSRGYCEKPDPNGLVIQQLVDGLMMSHRGQDAAGIVTVKITVNLVKDMGTVTDVFTQEAVMNLL